MTDEEAEKLLKARERAKALRLEADELLKVAQRALRRAGSAEGHYRSMLRRLQGEQPLPFVYENSQ